MAERPACSYTDLPEIEAEIRRVEQEVLETKLLHENLIIVHTLARNVLHRLNARIINNRQKQQPFSINSASTGASSSFQSPNYNANNCRNTGARVCMYSPNQCVHSYIPAGTQRQQFDNCNTGQIDSTSTSYDPCTSGTGTSPTGTTGGSTVAEIRIAADSSTQESQQDQSCYSSTYSSAPSPQQYLQGHTFSTNSSNSYQQQASPHYPYHSQQYPMFEQRHSY